MSDLNPSLYQAAPSTMGPYSNVSGDFSPIHTDPQYFAAFAFLPLGQLGRATLEVVMARGMTMCQWWHRDFSDYRLLYYGPTPQDVGAACSLRNDGRCVFTGLYPALHLSEDEPESLRWTTIGMQMLKLIGWKDPIVTTRRSMLSQLE
jgi:MaoC like domain